MKVRTLIAAGCTALFAVAGVSTVASAAVTDDVGPEGACYTQVTEPRYEKSTQTRTREYDEYTGWTEWSEYGELVDWPGVGPRDWGVVPDPLTGDHDGPETDDPTEPDNYNDRRFEYVIVDTREVDGERIPCEEHVDSPDVTLPTCDADGSLILHQSPSYTWTETGPISARIATAEPVSEWVVLIAPTQFGPYDLARLTDPETCGPPPTTAPPTTEPPTTTEPPLIEVTPEYETTPPTCTADGTVTPIYVEGVSWTLNDDGSYTASADDGYTLSEEVTTPVPQPKLTGEACEEPTTTTQPPATTKPPTTQPTTTTTQPDLPVTGSSTQTTAAFALLALAAGGLLVVVSRRRSIV